MKRLGWFFLFLTTFLSVVVYYYIALTKAYWPFDGIKKEELGTFGDSWGMLTSIFSVLAFLGVSYSLIMQTDAFKHSEDVAQKQQYHTLKQGFENNLFQMLSLLQEIISEIRIRKTNVDKDDDPVRVGRSTFKVIFELSYEKYKPIYQERKYDSLSEMYVHLLDLFRGTGGHTQFNLGHYFRFLYNIFRYIHDSNVSGEDKLEYAKIVRAQISNYELLLLFYNIMHVDGIKFQKYVVEYQIFDNLPVDKLLNPAHALLFDAKAYGENVSFRKDFIMDDFKKNNLLEK